MLPLMSSPAPVPGKRRTVKGYQFALVGVVVLGALYFWANSGTHGGVGDPRERGVDPARLTPPTAPSAQ